MMSQRRIALAPHGKEQGFTLVELMVTMILAAIITFSIYSAYLTQQASYTAQEQVAELQQNIRAALDLMSYDIRQAGCDPTGDAKAGLLIAQPGQMQVSMDITGGELDGRDNDDDGATDEADEVLYGDGSIGAGETITFNLSNITPTNLGRDSGGGLQTIAENISRIEFGYIDKDGTRFTTPPDTKNIRSVEVSLLAQASQADHKFTDTATYTTPAGTVWGPFGDNFRRRFVTLNVHMRNVGN